MKFQEFQEIQDNWDPCKSADLELSSLYTFFQSVVQLNCLCDRLNTDLHAKFTEHTSSNTNCSGTLDYKPGIKCCNNTSNKAQ